MNLNDFLKEYWRKFFAAIAVIIMAVAAFIAIRTGAPTDPANNVIPCLDCRELRQNGKSTCLTTPEIEIEGTVLTLRFDDDPKNHVDASEEKPRGTTKVPKLLDEELVTELNALLANFVLPNDSLNYGDVEILKTCGCKLMQVSVPDQTIDFNGQGSQASSAARNNGGNGVIASVSWWGNPKITLPKIRKDIVSGKPPLIPGSYLMKRQGAAQDVVAIIDSGWDWNNTDQTAGSELVWINEEELPESSSFSLGPNRELSQSILDGIMIKQPDPNCFYYDLFGYDFFNEDPIPNDDHGHGTVMALAIAGAAETSPRLKIMPLKVGDYVETGDGREFVIDLFSVKCAMYYAIEQGAKVINLSLGYYSTRSPDVQLMEIFELARENNVLVVCSAGNDRTDTQDCPHYPSGLRDSFPDNIIVVGAYDNEKEHCKQLWEDSNYGRQLDIAAPGVKIGPATATGTSVAAALVSRKAMEIRAGNPLITAAKLKAKLMSYDYSTRLENNCDKLPLLQIDLPAAANDNN